MTFFKSETRPKQQYRRNNRRGGRSATPSNLNKLLLLGGIPTITLIGGGLAMAYYMGIEQIDGDYCFDRPDQHQRMVFLDSSLGENLSPQQIRDYKRAFENAYDDAPANSRLSLFTTALDIGGSIAEPVAEICKPAATVAEMEEIGAPSETAPYLGRQADEAKAKYDEIVGRVIVDAQDVRKMAKDSPILENIQAISRYKGFQGRNRGLTTITDGVQNTETARFCQVQGDMPPLPTFKRQRRYQDIAPDSLEGVEVDLLLVESIQLPQRGLEHCTNDEIRQWWPEFFKANGASKVTSTRLRYGA